MQTEIRVVIDTLDGWHIATSNDLPGFILATENRELLLSGIRESVEMLYAARHGSSRCHVKLAI